MGDAAKVKAAAIDSKAENWDEEVDHDVPMTGSWVNQDLKLRPWEGPGAPPTTVALTAIAETRG